MSLKRAQDAAGGRGNLRLDRLPQDIERLLPVAAATSRLMLMPSGARHNPTRRAIGQRRQGSQRQHSAQATNSCVRRPDSGAGDPPSINFPTYSGRTWLPGW